MTVADNGRLRRVKLSHNGISADLITAVLHSYPTTMKLIFFGYGAAYRNMANAIYFEPAVYVHTLNDSRKSSNSMATSPLLQSIETLQKSIEIICPRTLTSLTCFVRRMCGWERPALVVYITPIFNVFATIVSRALFCKPLVRLLVAGLV